MDIRSYRNRFELFFTFQNILQLSKEGYPKEVLTFFLSRMAAKLIGQPGFDSQLVQTSWPAVLLPFILEEHTVPLLKDLNNIHRGKKRKMVWGFV